MYRIDRAIYRDAEMRKGELNFPIDLSTFKSSDGKTFYTEAEKSEQARNRFQEALIDVSNDACNKHKARIVGLAAGADFALSEVTTLLAGAGAIVTGETAARILSGGAGISNATRANMNEVFYQNFVTTAIVKAIEGEREQKILVLDGLKTKSMKDYSADDVVRRVNEYHEMCSFYRGLVALTAAAERIGPSLAAVEADMENLRVEIGRNSEFIAKLDASKDATTIAKLRSSNDELATRINELSLQAARIPASRGK